VLGERRHLPSETELLLFRVAQEALRNVWRHSQASQAWITLEFSPDKIKITVQDNGIGFQVPDRVGDLPAMGKLGLAGMYERAQLAGGTVAVESKLGKGTTITAMIPA
jgi:two-component system sensor histidine kinase DegS